MLLFLLPCSSLSLKYDSNRVLCNIYALMYYNWCIVWIYLNLNLLSVVFHFCVSLWNQTVKINSLWKHIKGLMFTCQHSHLKVAFTLYMTQIYGKYFINEIFFLIFNCFFLYKSWGMWPFQQDWDENESVCFHWYVKNMTSLQLLLPLATIMQKLKWQKKTTMFLKMEMVKYFWKHCTEVFSTFWD